MSLVVDPKKAFQVQVIVNRLKELRLGESVTSNALLELALDDETLQSNNGNAEFFSTENSVIQDALEQLKKEENIHFEVKKSTLKRVERIRLRKKRQIRITKTIKTTKMEGNKNHELIVKFVKTMVHLQAIGEEFMDQYRQTNDITSLQFGEGIDKAIDVLTHYLGNLVKDTKMSTLGHRGARQDDRPVQVKLTDEQRKFITDVCMLAINNAIINHLGDNRRNRH